LTGASHRTSEILLDLAGRQSGSRISLQDLLDALKDQGFGLLLLVLALPNAIPGPMIPGFSLVFALGLIPLGLQMMCGWHEPRLPRWLLRRSFDKEMFRRFATRTTPFLARTERWLKPRPNWLTTNTGEKFIGAAVVIFSLVLALPVPLGNLPLGLGISVIACGMLEGDGLALLIGLIGSSIALAWNLLILFAGAEALMFLGLHFAT